MVQVLPSILVNDRKDLVKKLKLVAPCPLVHIDIGDGLFVKNKTVQPPDFVGIDLSSAEIHLMVKDVDHYVEHFAHSGVECIVFHVEACKDSAEVVHNIRHIKDHGVKVGMALNPETNITKVKNFLKSVDRVLIMTVHPGFGGQKFIAKMLPKISALRKLDRKINIEVDGGINLTTAPLAAKAGANMFVAGNAIFSAKNPQKAYKDLLKRIKK